MAGVLEAFLTDDLRLLFRFTLGVASSSYKISKFMMICLNLMAQSTLSRSCQAGQLIHSLFSCAVTQGQVVQSMVSLKSLLVVKMLTVLVSTKSNSQLFLLKKCQYKSYSHFFSKNISIYADI